MMEADLDGSLVMPLPGRNTCWCMRGPVQVKPKHSSVSTGAGDGLCRASARIGWRNNEYIQLPSPSQSEAYMSLILLVFVINTKTKGEKLTKEDSMKKLSACPNACDTDFLKLQYLSPLVIFYLIVTQKRITHQIQDLKSHTAQFSSQRIYFYPLLPGESGNSVIGASLLAQGIL